MSRIGDKSIQVPKSLHVMIEKSKITLKGLKGELSLNLHFGVTARLEGDKIFLYRLSDNKRHKSAHGLYRSLVKNMVYGVTLGYKKELELVGVGFKAITNGNTLELNLGFSHSIYFKIPPEIKVKAISDKGKNPKINLEGIDKQLIGEVAAKIKSLRKVEPYKGKGIRFVGEQIRKKVGKTASK